ncbi:MAG: FAD-dependent thymidylate synthase, partial [Proteobacteria bacterium]|nr:FAD-dependent thymidylate synthase [Pseudomonadota bacterium]
DLIDDPAAAIALMETNTECAYECYQQLLKLGMAKELARTQLPLSTYTAWHWTANLHNTLHLLKLRLNPHAQYEIRVYAEAMLSQLETVFPLTINTWKRKVLRTKTVPIDEVQ